MKYTIYKIKDPEHLQIIIPDGCHQKVVSRSVLEKLDESFIESEHDTMEAAIEEIKNKKYKLKWTKLTILPVIDIGWNGEVE